MTDESLEDGLPPIPLPMEPLPWHDASLQRLGKALAGGRLPHALLLQGPEGVGKEHLAGLIAALLFCSGRAERMAACGTCPECALSRAGSHPDVHWLRIPEDRKSVSVDQVRALREKLAMTSLRGGYRVAIATPAHAMTPNAQNALLKTLEEPAPRTLLVLVSSHPSRLLATLRSRCQRIEVARPGREAAIAWLGLQLGHSPDPGLLELAGGSPFKALALGPNYASLQQQMDDILGALVTDRADVTQLASDMIGTGLPTRLDWLEAWLEGALRQRMAAGVTSLTLRGGAQLQRVGAEVNISAAFRMLDRLREARRLLEGSAAPQLVVEALLVDLAAACGRTGGREWVR